MFGSTTLDIVTGLVFIYLLYSLLATTIQEGIASLFGIRAKMFEEGVKRMLNDDDTGTFGDKFLDHPLIKFLGRDNIAGGLINRGPSYISAERFSSVITDLIRDGATGVDAAKDIDTFITTELKKYDDKGNLISGQIAILQKQTLDGINALWKEANQDITKFKTSLENWFDETMERVSGWYKRQTQVILLFIGLALAISFNIDTIQIVKKLSVDKDARTGLVNMAVQHNKSHPTLQNDTGAKSKAGVTTKDTLFFRVDSTLTAQLQGTNNLLGLGHSCDEFCPGSKNYNPFWKSALGWIITALAISLGAPFWFDLLQKVISLRGTGDTPEETDKKKAALKKT